MAGGKWARGLTAATPLAEAARRVLTARLETVRDSLPPALHESDKDREHVHRLRVGTRRAQAALDIFEPCLPAKVTKKAKKHLRRLRRAAGEARDWDVFLASLSAWAERQTAKHRPGLDCLLGYALVRRLVAQARLEETGKGSPFSFDLFLGKTVAAVRKARDPDLRTLGDLARPLLGGLLKELDRAAARDLDDDEHLHQVRIIGKRLRYAMEVFADCFAPPFREQLYPAVEQMQEILGGANDSQVACRRLKAVDAELKALLPEERKRSRPGLEKLLRYHEERLPEGRQRFRGWRCRWQQSGGEAAFNALLKTGPLTATVG